MRNDFKTLCWRMVSRLLGGFHAWGGARTLLRYSSTLFTLHPTSNTLHPALYTLHPTPYTLHPTTFSIHPTPYTLHPTPRYHAVHAHCCGTTSTQIARESSSSSALLSSLELIDATIYEP